VFVKEIVPRRAIAWVARMIYHENYVALPMRHQIARAASSCHVVYEWRHAGRWNGLAAEAAGAPGIPAEDSEETFITEHYWGYARQRDGGTVEYQVEHPRWPVRRASHATLDCDVAALYGGAFATCLCRPPSSAFICEGSPVTVRRGVRL